MAPDNQSMPLPILLRVPWFPPDPPPVVIVHEVHPVENAGPRSFPLVIQDRFRTAPSPWRAQSAGRRKGWIVLAVMTALVGGVMGWYKWVGQSPEESSPANSHPGVRADSSTAARGHAPRRAARLSPEIIPLDAGETP